MYLPKATFKKIIAKLIESGLLRAQWHYRMIFSLSFFSSQSKKEEKRWETAEDLLKETCDKIHYFTARQQAIYRILEKITQKESGPSNHGDDAGRGDLVRGFLKLKKSHDDYERLAVREQRQYKRLWIFLREIRALDPKWGDSEEFLKNTQIRWERELRELEALRQAQQNAINNNNRGTANGRAASALLQE